MRDYTDKCLMARQIDGVRWPRWHADFFNAYKVNYAHHRLIRAKYFRHAHTLTTRNFSTRLEYVTAMTDQIGKFNED